MNFKLKTGTGRSKRPSTKSGCEVPLSGPLVRHCQAQRLLPVVDLRRCQCGPAFGVRVPSGPKWQGTTPHWQAAAAAGHLEARAASRARAQIQLGSCKPGPPGPRRAGPAAGTPGARPVSAPGSLTRALCTKSSHLQEPERPGAARASSSRAPCNGRSGPLSEGPHDGQPGKLSPILRSLRHHGRLG